MVAACLGLTLNLGLLRNLQCIVNFDAEIPHRAFKLGMPEQQLHRPQVLGPPINQGRLCPPHGVGSIGSRVKAHRFDPAFDGS